MSARSFWPFSVGRNRRWGQEEDQGDPGKQRGTRDQEPEADEHTCGQSHAHPPRYLHQQVQETFVSSRHDASSTSLEDCSAGMCIADWRTGSGVSIGEQRGMQGSVTVYTA